jgi:3-hydroxyisobutyrate dehydrogenase-like beta-hydroxyacid dehydrogenase
MFSSIGLLHPGDMGAGIGATLVGAGHRVSWASSGRGASSARRAEAAGLVDVHSVEAMAQSCDLIISICPPSAALEVAGQVALAGFDGTYLDANAIAPATAREVAALVEQSAARYVDGGIIGGPPSPTSAPRLYLSGPSAPSVRHLFADTSVQAQVISEDQAAASALKMCFAAWTKGTTALLLDVRALAIAEGVEAPLLAEWEHSLPDLAGRSLGAAQQAATKGWRWVGEMEQIAATFGSAGLPDGFHLAAAEIYAKPDRDESAAADAATLANVLGALVNGPGLIHGPENVHGPQNVSSLARRRAKRSAEPARSVCTCR